ncbi:hypothetical protein [Vibrio owensii]|uniref:hypothetical protein n=1 Tax=Vibrio harveyi group TaxID=717610 RepID=UPI003CC675D6
MKKVLLTGLCLAALAGCSDEPVKIIYDCSNITQNDKQSLQEMYSRCDIGKTSSSSCKEEAIEAMCKPTPYLIPESYNGNDIKPALKTSEQSDKDFKLPELYLPEESLKPIHAPK